jgi:hypothetical protein
MSSTCSSGVNHGWCSRFQVHSMTKTEDPVGFVGGKVYEVGQGSHGVRSGT